MIEKTSDQYSLNKRDFRAAGKSAVVYFAPVLLLYVSGVLGILQFEGHHFQLKDLIPSQLVIDGFVTWSLMQAQGLIMRWAAEGKK